MTYAKAIIDYAADGDAVGVREALYSAIMDRVATQMEAKKQEIARNLVTSEAVEKGEEKDEDDKEDDDKDDKDDKKRSKKDKDDEDEDEDDKE